jgi:23S rRNA (uracil1939-C5)-methyltransferase
MLDCVHAASCPGCTQAGVPYDQQLDRKRRRLLDALRPFPELSAVAVAPTAPADPPLGYRTRAKWIVGPGGALGLFARGLDHRVLDLPGCQILAPPLLRVARQLREALASPGWLRDHLRAVDLREVRAPASSGVLLTLVVHDRPPPLLDLARAAAARLAAAAPDLLGVALNLVPPSSPQILGPTTLHLAGLHEADDAIGSSLVRATFGAFTQAHRGQAAALQDAIARQAQGPVLELYGGSGSLGLAIARRGFPVDSVESFAPASRAAADAAARAGVPLRALVGDAVQLARGLARDGVNYDLVVVNPPRRGLAPAVREAVAALGPRRVAYMSCEPGTLARDLAHLARLGYGAAEVAPHDMIPQTDEVETLALLERRPAPAPRLLLDAGETLFFAKEAHEAAEGSGGLAARVRALPGLEGAELAGAPEREVSGVSVFARGPGALAAGRAALAAGTWRWVAWVRGVTHRTGSLGGGARYRRRETRGGHALLEIEARTPQTRALRARLAALGHPVLGDERLGHEETNRHFFEKFGLDRPFWHGAELHLSTPGAGALSVACPWPADLALPEGPKPR